MENGENQSPAVFGGESEASFEQSAGYAPKKRARALIWIAAALIFCAASITAALLLSAPPERRLQGNAAVVAAYDFLNEQSKAHRLLTGAISKELSGRIMSEPFEMKVRLTIDSESFENSPVPIENIAIDLNAKYDLNDLGVKISAFGMKLLGAYLIGDEFVLEMIGKSGGAEIPVKGLDKPMPLGKRLKSVFPFLPDDESVYIDVLEKLSLAVPGNLTTTEKKEAYSPKEDMKIGMDVTTVSLDSEAISKTAERFRDGIGEDKALSNKLQSMVDAFTEYFGLPRSRLGGLLDELAALSGSGDLKDVNVSLSVYRRGEKTVGIGACFEGAGKNISITSMCEYDGQDQYQSSESNIDGVVSFTTYHTKYSGDKITMSGRIEVSGGYQGNAVQLINGNIEFLRTGANEYRVSGEFDTKGDVGSDSSGIAEGMSAGIDINMEVTVGGGLGTLKENPAWNKIYDKDRGSLGDMFKDIFPPGVFGGSLSPDNAGNA